MNFSTLSLEKISKFEKLVKKFNFCIVEIIYLLFVIKIIFFLKLIFFFVKIKNGFNFFFCLKNGIKYKLFKIKTKIILLQTIILNWYFYSESKQIGNKEKSTNLTLKQELWLQDEFFNVKYYKIKDRKMVKNKKKKQKIKFWNIKQFIIRVKRRIISVIVKNIYLCS